MFLSNAKDTATYDAQTDVYMPGTQACYGDKDFIEIVVYNWANTSSGATEHRLCNLEHVFIFFLIFFFRNDYSSIFF